MNYLVLRASDDAHGQGSWEWMANVRPADLPAARAEAQALLAHAMDTAPGPRGPEEDGGVWDASWMEQTEDDGWVSLFLTLTGPWDWGQTLAEN